MQPSIPDESQYLYTRDIDNIHQVMCLSRVKFIIQLILLTSCSDHYISFLSHIIDEMPPYDDWNKIDEEEDEELQDTSVTELKLCILHSYLTCPNRSSVLSGMSSYFALTALSLC